MFCKYCGNKIDDDALFCSKCGRRLVTEKIAMPAEPAPTEQAQPLPQNAAGSAQFVADSAPTETAAPTQTAATAETAPMKAVFEATTATQSVDGFDFHSWIAKNGLDAYENALRSQDCDTKDVLIALTDGDLERIGIDSVGGRRKILNAIEKIKPPANANTYSNTSTQSSDSDTSTATGGYSTRQDYENWLQERRRIRTTAENNFSSQSGGTSTATSGTSYPQTAQENLAQSEGASEKHSSSASPKNRTTAALLAFFTGEFGFHSFYAGRASRGVWQLILGIIWVMFWGVSATTYSEGFSTMFILTAIASAVWALVDFILILSGRFTDGDGRLILNW